MGNTVTRIIRTTVDALGQLLNGVTFVAGDGLGLAAHHPSEGQRRARPDHRWCASASVRGA
jgi:hypothetical protein